MKTNQRHPNADWSWWKITGAGLIGFGLFGFIIAIMPPQSLLFQVLGITSIVIAVVFIGMFFASCKSVQKCPAYGEATKYRMESRR